MYSLFGSGCVWFGSEKLGGRLKYPNLIAGVGAEADASHATAQEGPCCGYVSEHAPNQGRACDTRVMLTEAVTLLRKRAHHVADAIRSPGIRCWGEVALVHAIQFAME